MSGERLAELAVKSVIDYLDSNLHTYLDAVESARSLAAATLVPPADIVGADLPEYGGATPLIEVFENAGKPINLENEHWSFDLSIILTHACDAGIEAGRQFVRDYVTAIVDCLNAGRTLGSKVGSCLITDVSFASNHGSTAKHLIHAAIGVEIRIFD
jgi:pyocin large subunit-like protein